MSPDDWWARMSAVWFCIGWRALADESNYNVADTLDMIASLMMRLRRLEALELMRGYRAPFGWIL